MLCRFAAQHTKRSVWFFSPWHDAVWHRQSQSQIIWAAGENSRGCLLDSDPVFWARRRKGLYTKNVFSWNVVDSFGFDMSLTAIFEIAASGQGREITVGLSICGLSLRRLRSIRRLKFMFFYSTLWHSAKMINDVLQGLNHPAKTICQSYCHAFNIKVWCCSVLSLRYGLDSIPI